MPLRLSSRVLFEPTLEVDTPEGQQLRQLGALVKTTLRF